MHASFLKHMKLIVVSYILSVCFCLGCNSHSKTDYLIGKWKCIRVDMSPSKTNTLDDYRVSTAYGTILEFKKNNVITIIYKNDTSSHYYTTSDDNKFLMYEGLGSAASFQKIIELNKDSFKLAFNFDDTLVFSKMK
jgi:hypothetical protein